jgi:hypothetical protein
LTTQTKLNWMTRLDEFSPQQQKALLALSDDHYEWRSRDRLIAVTGMTPAELDKALAELIKKNLARPAFSKKRSIIFGLRERVDKK